jgi:hypothetical protein
MNVEKRECLIHTGCNCDELKEEAREQKPDYPYPIMEFYIRGLKGKKVYDDVKAKGVPITHENIQRHLSNTLISKRIDEDFTPYDVLSGMYYTEYPAFKSDEKLRCATFCEELFREQRTLDGRHGWYNKGIQERVLERCDLPPLKDGDPIQPYNNVAYMKGYFESPYGKMRLNEIGDVEIDLRASVWRASSELQDQYPSTGEERGLSGFRYTHSGWLDMPGFHR